MDVVGILRKLEELHLIRLNQQNDEWYSIYCPFHSNGQEKRASAGVLMRPKVKGGVKYPEGLVHCFTCHYAKSLPDAITDLLHDKHISKTGLEWLKENIAGFDIEDAEIDYLLPRELVETIEAQYAVKQVQSLLNQNITQYVSEEELARYRFTVPYMYERKFTDEAIALYDIGFQADWIPPGRKNPIPCITIPVRDLQGRTLFLCRRSIEGKIYNYPKDVLKPVFGIDVLPSNCKSVVVCEGAINAITAHIYGYNAVALLGTGTQYQINSLKRLGLQSIVLCLDGDEAGRNAAAKLKRALSKNCIVWTMNMPLGKDVNDCTKEEFDEIYKNRC